ncbi:ankyrin [Penicillium cataractarum]|uniref:Ankyrin n=1 Tax=Penicillium cataractarum TaxID=2100454 RepID=A0A9W9SLC8_9EURO|nr:ankyrin [Penicillium cataractarum]KAJ5380691.1 ankyrin [Penicillium cataractarum]
MAEAEADEPRGSSLQNLPAEILHMIVEHMEYASDVHALSQTCRRLAAFGDKCLVSHFASQCSPRGLNRLIKNRNLTAVHTLVSNPNFSFLP